MIIYCPILSLSDESRIIFLNVLNHTILNIRVQIYELRLLLISHCVSSSPISGIPDCFRFIDFPQF